MKVYIEALIKQSLAKLIEDKKLPGIVSIPASYKVSEVKDSRHGDYMSNIAFILAKQNSLALTPEEIAYLIKKNIVSFEKIAKIEVAPTGFLNFFVSKTHQYKIIANILIAKNKYGHTDIGKNKRILLEFVSANPTGPLHIGHGRSAAYGSTLANLMRAIGFEVDCEYYVNNAGRQIDILAVSVYLRYLELLGVKNLYFPQNAYQGDYIYQIAKDLYNKYHDKLKHSRDEVYADIDKKDDPEMNIDRFIENIKGVLKNNYGEIFNTSAEKILGTIKKDLAAFGVSYQTWFLEEDLIRLELMVKTVKRLKSSGFTYEKDGALWFKSSKFGDEKDRVILRKNGQSTYFASDIAYHDEKFSRQVNDKTYHKIINIFGADHHGYILRIKAAIKALGYDEKKMEVLLVQFANLYRNKQKIAMSTRSGNFITLKSLYTEIGVDATRFFYILRRSEQHLDFDINLAKSKTMDNPVYYIQYAHARIYSVLKKVANKVQDNIDFSLLNSVHEQNLISELNRYQNILTTAALNYEPHKLANYLQTLAACLHSYYGAQRLLVKNENILNARLALLKAVKQIIKNGLSLLGVRAQKSM